MFTIPTSTLVVDHHNLLTPLIEDAHFNFLNVAEGMTFVPHFLYNQQGNARETMLGAYLQKNVNEETDIMIGAYYRYKDAVAPFLGVDYKKFLIGLSYDVNASKLGTYTRNANSFELSFTYIMRKGSKSLFDFIHCPRL